MIRTVRTISACALFLFAFTPTGFGQESWDVVQAQGRRIGYMHVRVEPVKDKSGRQLQRVRVDWSLTFKRGRDVAKITQEYGTIETPDGTILRLDTRTEAGGDTMRTFGDVKDGSMRLTLENHGTKRFEDVPWGDDVRGPYAAELSLSRDKISPGATREIKTYVPDMNKICLTKLAAKDYENVPLGSRGEVRKLLRVEQSLTDLAGKALPELDSTLWVDESGQIMKSHTAMLGGVDIFRTTREGALGGDGRAEFDLLAASIIKCPRIENSDKTRNIVYRVTMDGEDPSVVFPKDRRQSVKAGADRGTATIEVKSRGAADGEVEDAPDAAFLRANPLINSDDARVIQHMKKAVGREVDPWAKAVAIEHYVATNVADKNFGVAFAAAAQVARNMQGDCSEHSVLVAAMCRAAGIPTRCAVGLVYSPPMGGFGPHMWNEVYVNRRWVAIDAAFDQSEVDATHIKLSTSSLDGVAPFDAFMPVLKVFNKMKVQPVEIR